MQAKQSASVPRVQLYEATDEFNCEPGAAAAAEPAVRQFQCQGAAVSFDECRTQVATTEVATTPSTAPAPVPKDPAPGPKDDPADKSWSYWDYIKAGFATASVAAVAYGCYYYKVLSFYRFCAANYYATLNHCFPC